MTQRGKKSNTTIAGHTLTWAELTVLNQLRDFLRGRTDGRSPLHYVFPGSEEDARQKRWCARHLAEIGVLAACEIEFVNDTVKGKTTP